MEETKITDVEFTPVETVAETSVELVDHEISQEDVDLNPGAGFEVGDVVGLPVEPPQDNEHVAEGCEKFDEPEVISNYIWADSFPR